MVAIGRRAHAEPPAWSRQCAQVGAQEPLPDAAAGIRIREVREAEPGSVLGEARSQLEGATAGARTDPARPDHVVPPVPVDAEGEVLRVHAREVEHVRAAVRGEPDAPAPARPCLRHGLEVGQVVGEIEDRPEELIEVGAARRRAPTCAREPERSRVQVVRNRHARGEHRDAAVHAETPVSGIALDVKHRRDAPAEARGEAPRRELRAREHVRVEYREEAAQMEGGEHGQTVEQD